MIQINIDHIEFRASNMYIVKFFFHSLQTTLDSCYMLARQIVHALYTVRLNSQMSKSIISTIFSISFFVLQFYTFIILCEWHRTDETCSICLSFEIYRNRERVVKHTNNNNIEETNDERTNEQTSMWRVHLSITFV